MFFGTFLNYIGFLLKGKALSSKSVCDATVAKPIVMQQHNISLLSCCHWVQTPPRRFFPFILSVPLISSVSLISLSHSQSIVPSFSGQLACRYQFPGLVLSGCVPAAAAAVVSLFQPSTILTAVQIYGTYNDLITVKLYGIYIIVAGLKRR